VEGIGFEILVLMLLVAENLPWLDIFQIALLSLLLIKIGFFMHLPNKKLVDC